MMGWGNMMGGWGYGPGFYGGNFGWAGMLIGMVIQVIFWIIIIVIAVKLFRSYNKRGQMGHFSGNNALNILRERYARGEIDTEEYNRRKQDLLH